MLQRFFLNVVVIHDICNVLYPITKYLVISLFLVSILGGLASMTDKTSDILNELTSNVLSAIQNSTNGYEIHPLTGNFTIAELLENDDTIPIFQDFIILLNDAQNLNDSAIQHESNDDPLMGVDLTNATIVFNPSTFTIGDIKTKLDPQLNETLRENIINAVKVSLVYHNMQE